MPPTNDETIRISPPGASSASDETSVQDDGGGMTGRSSVSVFLDSRPVRDCRATLACACVRSAFTSPDLTASTAAVACSVEIMAFWCIQAMQPVSRAAPARKRILGQNNGRRHSVGQVFLVRSR